MMRKGFADPDVKKRDAFEDDILETPLPRRNARNSCRIAGECLRGGAEEAFGPWLPENADDAWEGRRKPDNLSRSRWPQPAAEGQRFSQGNGSGVVLFQMVKRIPTEKEK